MTIANEVRGIGQDIFDLSTSFGSGGRLRSLVVMDWLGKYPDDPTQKFLGENNTLSVLGQEVGHRWLAYVDFRDRTGARSDALLGRDDAHWSFFFDSDASVMEGNDIEDLGGGQFRTVDAVKRYSRLDQYMMGLIPPSQRADVLLRREPELQQGRAATRRDRRLVHRHAPRRADRRRHRRQRPAQPRRPTTRSKVYRQAFIYVVSNGRTADSAQVAKLDRIRSQWEAFFGTATEGRMTGNTRLR